MSLVRVPLQPCSLLAVAELKDVFMRTVAWLPAGIVPALTPRAEQNNNMVNTTNLRNVIIFFSSSGLLRQFMPWKSSLKILGACHQLMILSLLGIGLSAIHSPLGNGGTNALLAFRAAAFGISLQGTSNFSAS